MIYSRFIKYLKVLSQNRKPFIRTLFNLVSKDAKSLTGSNVRKILLQTDQDPLSLDRYCIRSWRVYPPKDGWSVPLLRSLMNLRDDEWVLVFDEEEEDGRLQTEDLSFMIDTICRG